MAENEDEARSPRYAQLQWDDQSQPLSTEFGDIYFTRLDGLAETRHVFLMHNQLAERWTQLADGDHFCIAETGFGSGLNFLAAWALWLDKAPARAQLHFVSVEKYPLQKTDLFRALALWPELAELANELIEHYPSIIGSGFHRRNLMGGRIKLTLIIDDAAAGFSKLLPSPHPLFCRSGPKVDAWFLDGFAPAKNPQMWSDALFTVIGQLSQANTTAATFSAAAIVKNGLCRAGFSVEKVKGFGHKREMVKATYSAVAPVPDPDDFRYRGSFSPYPSPWAIALDANTSNRAANRQAIIIGGGLAGCHSARALADRGWQVTLIERSKRLAQGASGNPQGVLYAKLSPLNEAQAAFNMASLQYAQHYYQPLWPLIGEKCGVLQLAYKPGEQELHRALQARFINAPELVEFVDAERASQLAGIKLNYSGLYFPQAGWIDPRQLCAELVAHANIQVIYDQSIAELRQSNSGEAEAIWQVRSTTGVIAEAAVVVLASAADANKFPQANHLPAKTIRGQITYLPELTRGRLPNTVVCAEGYITPPMEGTLCIGATFNLRDTDNELREVDHLANLSHMREHTPAIADEWDNLDASRLDGRVSFRCTFPDYLPVVGPLPIVDKMLEDFAPLRKNAKAGVITPGSYFKGLYINIGHGARGLAYTPLCAELLAAQINGEILPVATELAHALNPARFVIRDIIKGKR